MKSILFEQLNELDEELITSFFDSYLIETDYFHCTKDNLVSLKDYLVELKLKKRNYDIRTMDIVSKVKEKNRDIKFIEPYFSNINSLAVYEKDKLVITSCYSKELLELSNIIKDFDYVKEENGFISISNNFIINPLCFSIIQLLLKDNTLLAELYLNDNNYEVRKHNNKYLKRHTKDNVKRIYFIK